MTRLVVIAGPANSGKMPLARRLMAEDPSLVLVHRDTLRDSLVGLRSEAALTILMERLGAGLLDMGHSVICCAWNMEPRDRAAWMAMARHRAMPLEWMDTRDPAVQARIPPLEGWSPPETFAT